MFVIQFNAFEKETVHLDSHHIKIITEERKGCISATCISLA